MSTSATHRQYVLGPGEGDAHWFVGQLLTWKASGEDTDGAFSVIEVDMPAGAASPLHVHHREHEAFYLLEGEVTFQVGGERLEAPAGSFVFLPRGVPHAFLVGRDRNARALMLFWPTAFADLFRELGEPAGPDGAAPAGGPPDHARFAAVAERYGLEVVGPPIG
jgi:quercetin dioxygenase-like cupin family protein